MSRKTTLRLLIVIALIFLVYWIIYLIGLHQVKKTFQNINDEETHFSYQDVDLSLLRMSLIIKNPDFSKGEKMRITARFVELSGINPIALIRNNAIKASSLDLDAPYIMMNNALSTIKSDKSNVQGGDIDINIDNSIIKNGHFKIFHRDTTLVPLESINIEGEIKNFVLNRETLRGQIPFGLSDFKFSLDSLQLPVDSYHKLFAHKTVLAPDMLEVKYLQIDPLLTKEKFHQVIQTERDYMNLKGALLKIKSPMLLSKQNKIGFSSEMISLDRFHFDIYRDKRLNDDTTIKPLYSEMLRKLDTHLTIDSIAVSNSTIIYTEHPDSDADPGVLEFHKIALHSGPLSNTRDAKPVHIKIHSSFMNQAPMKVEWSFKIADTTDFFNIKGALSNIPAKSLNSFLTPVMQVKAKGALDKLYFNFDGNSTKANGAMQLSFKQFDVEIYDQETKKIKSLLSSIANMIIGGQENKGMVKKEGITVERDQTKSFWNYFWLCIRSGLFEIIV